MTPAETEFNFRSPPALGLRSLIAPCESVPSKYRDTKADSLVLLFNW